MVKSVDRVPTILFSLMLASLPFSIAANSVLLAALTGWMVFEWMRSGNSFKTLKDAGHPLTWAMIPLIYGISILYSHDLTRAFNQWLNMAPLLVLPLFFLVFDLNKKLSGFRMVTGLALCGSLVAHAMVNAGIISLSTKESGMFSLFHDSEKNAWIFWAGFMSWIGAQERPAVIRVFQWALFLGLLYFGNLWLILLAAISWFVSETRFKGISLPLIGPMILIAGGSMVVFALVFFPAFTVSLREAGQNVLAITGQTSASPGLNDFFVHLRMGMIQWWTHPFAGTGVGDYIHAMWNEYHVHGLEAPNYPHSQLIHLLVSTGIMTVGAAWALVKSWKPLPANHRIILALILASFVFMAPLKSQISSTALMIAVLLIPCNGKSQD